MGAPDFKKSKIKKMCIRDRARADQPNLDFGKHVIPYCHENGAPMYAYEFNGYWKDVGTLNSYWEAVSYTHLDVYKRQVRCFMT